MIPLKGPRAITGEIAIQVVNERRGSAARHHHIIAIRRCIPDYIRRYNGDRIVTRGNIDSRFEAVIGLGRRGEALFARWIFEATATEDHAVVVHVGNVPDFPAIQIRNHFFQAEALPGLTIWLSFPQNGAGKTRPSAPCVHA
jgi:hypothetical protein